MRPVRRGRGPRGDPVGERHRVVAVVPSDEVPRRGPHEAVGRLHAGGSSRPEPRPAHRHPAADRRAPLEPHRGADVEHGVGPGRRPAGHLGALVVDLPGARAGVDDVRRREGVGHASNLWMPGVPATSPTALRTPPDALSDETFGRSFANRRTGRSLAPYRRGSHTADLQGDRHDAETLVPWTGRDSGRRRIRSSRGLRRPGRPSSRTTSTPAPASTSRSAARTVPRSSGSTATGSCDISATTGNLVVNVVVSNTAVATVSPSQLTFTACNQHQASHHHAVGVGTGRGDAERVSEPDGRSVQLQRCHGSRESHGDAVKTPTTTTVSCPASVTYDGSREDPLHRDRHRGGRLLPEPGRELHREHERRHRDRIRRLRRQQHARAPAAAPRAS